jgi:hypothetical protein
MDEAGGAEVIREEGLAAVMIRRGRALRADLLLAGGVLDRAAGGRGG